MSYFGEETADFCIKHGFKVCRIPAFPNSLQPSAYPPESYTHHSYVTLYLHFDHILISGGHVKNIGGSPTLNRWRDMSSAVSAFLPLPSLFLSLSKQGWGENEKDCTSTGCIPPPLNPLQEWITANMLYLMIL